MQKKKTRESQKKILFLRPRIFWVIIIAAFLMGGSLFWELNVGNIAYYIKWHKCGHQPLIAREEGPLLSTSSSQSHVKVYTHLGFFDEKLPSFFNIAHATAYCSLDEAHQKYGPDLQVQN